MPESLLHPIDCKSAAVMRSERLRMRADLVEMIAGAKLTITRSRALLATADAILNREKLPLVALKVSSFDAGR